MKILLKYIGGFINIMKNFIKMLISLPNNIINFFTFLFAKVDRPKNITIKGRIRLVNRGKILLGENSKINCHIKYNPIGFDSGTNLVAEKNATISIGNNFHMSNSTIYSRCSITIGDNVFLGGGCKIYDTDFHSLNYKYRGTLQDKEKTICKPVKLGNNVFIGAGTIILKGVEIGDYAVIGAGSVVAKSIACGEIWAGNPAKFIKIIKEDNE